LEQAKGDAKKAEYLRWAQMWATFGSTPGPVLRAAVMSINNTIPDLIEDQDKARAIQKEINKSIHDLDRAALMEKKGRLDDAYKLDQEAKGNLAKISLDISKLQVHEFETKRTSAAQMASAEMQKQATIQSAALRAAAIGGGSETRENKERRVVEQAIDKAYKDQTEAKRKQLDGLKRISQMSPENQKKYQPQVDQIERELSETRKGIEARYKKDYPDAFKETAPADSSKADTSGWGELRVKG
jgi:hypothetical protein